MLAFLQILKECLPGGNRLKKIRKRLFLQDLPPHVTEVNLEFLFPLSQLFLLVPLNLNCSFLFFQRLPSPLTILHLTHSFNRRGHPIRGPTLGCEPAMLFGSHGHSKHRRPRDSSCRRQIHWHRPAPHFLPSKIVIPTIHNQTLL